MKRFLKIASWIGVVLILLLIIFWPKIKLFRQGKSKGVLTEGKTQAVRVKAMVARPSDLQEVIKATGTLIADEQVDLTFEMQGKIKNIFFTEGAKVNKGQLLAKLNDDDLQAQLTKLKLQNNLLQEKANRQKILLEREAISRESYDQLITDLQSNEAEIKMILVNIDKTEIRAPFDGIIGLRYLSEGAYVTSGMRISRLIKIKPLKVEFSVPERYADNVKAGNSLKFRIEGSSEEYSAKVYAIEPIIDATTRTMTLRALFPNEKSQLQPGRYITVQLIIREKKDALKLPTEAIIPELGSEKVFVIKNGKAAGSKVTIGLRTPEFVEITDGVNAGDTIVISGIMQLRSGMPVSITAVDSAYYQ
jgi:membrane fusion protein (multidrug efflux system)